MTKYGKAKDKYDIKIGRLAGEKWNVYRPDYTIVDGTPTLKKSNVLYRVDPTGAKRFTEPNFKDIEVYDTFGPKGFLQEGDVLIQGTFTNPSLSKGSCTVLHWGTLKALITMRTSRYCNIAKGQDDETGVYDYLYKNVLYDVLGNGFPQGQMTFPIDKTGTPITTSKVSLYFRQNLASANYSGLTLLETTNAGVETGRKWLITEVSYSGPIMVLDLTRRK